MGFSVPNLFKTVPTADEELFKKAWDVIESDVLRLTQEGWDYSLRGQADLSLKSYQGANIHYYFVFMAQAVRNNLQLKGTLDLGCNSMAVDEKYGLTCIEDKMPCLSTWFDVDYRKSWDKIMAIFEIDRQTSQCDTCCVGIGEMIIEHDDECISLVVGPCDGIPDYSVEGVEAAIGEWGLGEFGINEFTNFNETD